MVVFSQVNVPRQSREDRLGNPQEALYESIAGVKFLISVSYPVVLLKMSAAPFVNMFKCDM